MRIIFTGGGTAGHINPAIGVAQALGKDDTALFVGRAGGAENRLVENEGFELRGLNIHGLERK
jgi:UDP-N-acetylglucosamine--N-acetylmuramyl-(pentapeptide) pyrophosphoryl-undecaprenol N-acetylglucosamine transferase